MTALAAMPPMTPLRVHLPRLHPGQQAIVDKPARFKIARMGRRFGKTKLGIRRIADVSIPGHPVAWFAPGYRYMTEVWREAKHYLRPLIATKNEAEHRLELVTGGVLDFWTLTDDDPARGRRYKLAVIDEAGMVRGLLDKWNKSIRPTLTDYRGDALFLGTPKGNNEFKHMHDAAQGRDGWATFHAPSSANPHLDPDEIEAARLDMPELVFRQEYLAEFVDFAGSLVRREWLRYAPAPTDIRIGMGVDLAISKASTADYTAIGVVGIGLDGQRFVLDMQRDRLTFREACAFIVQMAEKWAPAQIQIEEVQFQAAVVQELLATTRLPIVGVRPDRDKITRFAPLAVRYERGLVTHTPGLPGAFEDELLTFPDAAHDDQIDAVVMAESAAMAAGSGMFATAKRRL